MLKNISNINNEHNHERTRNKYWYFMPFMTIQYAICHITKPFFSTHKLVCSQLFEGTALHSTFSYRLFVILFDLRTYPRDKVIPVQA